VAFLFDYLVISKHPKMKTNSFFIIALFGMLFVSCSSEKSTKEYMIDSWETSHLKIEMPTYQKSDSIYVFEDDFKNNPPRRAQSKYNRDGTFTAWYVNPENIKAGETNGQWSVKKDSLFIEYFYDGKTVKVGYFIEKTEAGFQGTSKSDWDNDGENDDLLIMNTKRLELDK